MRTQPTTPESVEIETIDTTVTEAEATMPEGLQWMLEASCRGVSPTDFFPSDGSGVERAMRVCATCPVRVECLDYALEHRIEHGVWGGASERERRRILKRRAAPV